MTTVEVDSDLWEKLSILRVKWGVRRLSDVIRELMIKASELDE